MRQFINSRRKYERRKAKIARAMVDSDKENGYGSEGDGNGYGDFDQDMEFVSHRTKVVSGSEGEDIERDEASDED